MLNNQLFFQVTSIFSL